jgi:hypothetical protein
MICTKDLMCWTDENKPIVSLGGFLMARVVLKGNLLEHDGHTVIDKLCDIYQVMYLLYLHIHDTMY